MSPSRKANASDNAPMESFFNTLKVERIYQIRYRYTGSGSAGHRRLDCGLVPPAAPLMVPSLASAWLLTFSLSLDSVVLSAFLSGPGSSTLPLVVFSRARLGLSPAINAVATVTVVVVATCIVLASWYMARRTLRMDREFAQAARASP